MVYCVAFTLFLFVPAAGLMQKTGRRLFACLPLLCCGLILTGYCLALLGKLAWFPLFATALFAGGLGLFCAELIRTRRLSSSFFSMELPVYFASAVFFWLTCRSRVISQWDEVSHWGGAVKFMCATNRLYTDPASGSVFLEYPPATALFQYLGQQLKAGFWREDLLYLSFDLLLLAFLLWPLSRMDRKRPVAMGAVAALLLAVPVSFVAEGYHTLLVDLFLGIVLAFSIGVAAFGEKDDGFSQALLCGGLFVLTLTKSTGFGLALVVALAVAGRALLARPRQLSARRLAFGLGPVAAALAAHYSWALHLKLVHAATKWQGTIDLLSLFNGTAPAYRYTVLKAFGAELLSLWPWVALVAAVALARWLWVKKPLGRDGAFCLATAALSAVAFSVGLLAGYLFLFSQGEAVVLASVDRYNATLLCALVLCGAQVLLFTRPKPAAKPLLSFVPIVLLFVLCLGINRECFTDFAYETTHTAQCAALTRQKMSLAVRGANVIRAVRQEDKRVYFISQQDNGEALMYIDYQLCPTRLGQEYSGVGTLYENIPSATLPLDLAQWQALLYDGYDYVYLYNIDTQFIVQFLPLFENDGAAIGPSTLFRVERHPDGTLTLVETDAKAYTLAAGFDYI